LAVAERSRPPLSRARALGQGFALPATANAYAARFACLLGSASPTPPRFAWHPQCGAGSFRSRLAQLDRWWLVWRVIHRPAAVRRLCATGLLRCV